MSGAQNTSHPGSTATGSAASNGESPYPTRRENAPAPEPELVSGEYAAKQGGGKLTPEARRCLAQLSTVKVDDLKTAGAAGALNGSTWTTSAARAFHDGLGKTWNPERYPATLAAVKTAVAGVDPTKKIALTTLIAAADEGHEWAAKAVDAARGDNIAAAMRVGYAKRPESYTTAQLYGRGVPAAALKSLPRSDDAARGESARILMGWDAADRAEASREARGTDTPPPDLDADALTFDRLAEMEPVVPLIYGLLAEGELAEIIGDPGTGKTFISLGQALSLAAGRDWCGHKVPKAVPVLYVLAEGARGVEVRVKAHCAEHGITAEDLDDRFRVYPKPVQLHERDHMREVREYVAKHGIKLVVFDTRARCTVGLEENSATQQGEAIKLVEEINRDTGAAVLVVHHTAKGGDNGRGSNAWLGAVWTSLLVTRTGKSTTVTITCAKHKEWPDKCSHKFTMTKVTVPADAMPGRDEKQRRSLALTGHDQVTEDIAEAKAETEKGEQIKAIFHTYGASTGLTKAEGRGHAKVIGIARTTYDRYFDKYVKRGGPLVAMPGKSAHFRLRTDATVSTVGTDENRETVDALKAALCKLVKDGEIAARHTKTDAAKMLGGPDATAFAQAWGWFETQGRPDAVD